MDAPSPGKTGDGSSQHPTGYPNAYPYGISRAAEQGTVEVFDKPKLRWLTQEERDPAGKLKGKLVVKCGLFLLF